jgi:hypothetical protein
MSVFVLTVVLLLGTAAAGIYRWACARAERKVTDAYLVRKATDAYLDRALADSARAGRRANNAGLFWVWTVRASARTP